MLVAAKKNQLQDPGDDLQPMGDTTLDGLPLSVCEPHTSLLSQLQPIFSPWNGTQHNNNLFHNEITYRPYTKKHDKIKWFHCQTN